MPCISSSSALDFVCGESEGAEPSRCLQAARTERIPSARYDQRAEDLTTEGMKSGIKDSAAFILFLSSGVLLRPVRACERGKGRAI